MGRTRIWSRDNQPWILILEHERPGHFDESRRELALAIAAQMSEAQTLCRRQAQHYVEELELKGLLSASEKLSGAAHVAGVNAARMPAPLEIENGPHRVHGRFKVRRAIDRQHER